MGQIVQLPNDQHALLRDRSQISERLRRPFMSHMMKMTAAQGNAGDLSEADAGRLLLEAQGWDGFARMQDLAVVALVESWSFPLPVTEDGILDLPGDAYDALTSALQSRMMEDLMPTSFAPEREKDSPTSVSTV